MCVSKENEIYLEDSNSILNLTALTRTTLKCHKCHLQSTLKNEKSLFFSRKFSTNLVQSTFTEEVSYMGGEIDKI